MLSILSYIDCQKQWNSEEDIEHVVKDLNNNINSIESLQFSGNTLGVKAAETLVEPLSNQSKLNILLWNDLFTGRLKTEIGVALKSLSLGLMNAKVNLVELDLSDNAFGPNGVIGVTELLASPCCYTLKVLNMNNQGLGHQGCRYLVDALKTSRINSNQKGMNLEVFIAGRNRLENAGMKMLEEVFGDGMNSLKKILQNGIGVHGIDGVKDFILSIRNHSNLKILNISDNTIKPDGMKLISKVLTNFKELEEIYLGDCLIGNAGLNNLTKAMYEMSSNLKIISVSGNEITGRTAKNFISGLLETKIFIKSINLTENEIKSSFEYEIKDIMRDHDREDAWVEEEKDQYSDEDDVYDDNSYETESDDNSDDDYSEGDTNSQDESDVNTDTQEETHEECSLENLETSQNQKNIFYSNTTVAPFVLKNNYKFGNKNSSPSELQITCTQSNIFNTKPQHLSNSKTTKSSDLGISSVIEKNENQSFSFLQAANISSINNNHNVNKLNQYIMDSLESESVMLVSKLLLTFNKKVDKSCLDSTIYQVAESNPENAVRLGFILCDNFETFDIGTSIINFVLTSYKSWSSATNAFLVEMHCIKSEDKHFVPFCKEHSTLPFQILRNILDMKSLLSNEVRLNLVTVLKNLYKVSYDEKDYILRDLECCISNLNI